MNRGNQEAPNEALALPSFSAVGVLVAQSISAFAKRHKVITSSYLFGILFLLLLGSGTKLTASQLRQYNTILDSINVQAEYDASMAYSSAYAEYKSRKGWVSCDPLCQRSKRRMESSKAHLDAIRAEGYARMSDAKATAGIFSEVGVEEVTDSFWSYFSAGKQYAKRQSMWDALFMGMRHMSRDESFVEYALRMLMQVLINFSMGLVMALLVFVFGLWSIVQSYQPNPLSAAIFFLGAACAAFAVVTSYLFLVYGAAAGSVYGVAKVVEHQARLEGNGGARGAPRQRRNVGYRPHYQ